MIVNKNKTELKVTPTTINSSNINLAAVKKVLHRRQKKLTAEDYIKGILEGNHILLSRAITLLESTRLEHQALAEEIITQCLPHTGHSIRLGITGTPGVGKSTFIETLGLHLLTQKRQVAVLTVDPSSQISRGSILGDKTRMEKLSAHKQTFIRPSPTGDSLGGVARKTRETILLCEAAGFDTIIVETVGVGQSETAVHSMVDFFLLLLLPRAGDELQGIKRGIVEMADLIAINKADEGREKAAKHARHAYQNALHLFPPKPSEWNTKVVICSGLSGMGVKEIWALVLDYQNVTTKNTYFKKHRQIQAKHWLREEIQTGLQQLFFKNKVVKTAFEKLELAVLNGTSTPFSGANELLKLFSKELRE